jgi:hypothetical protein
MRDSSPFLFVHLPLNALSGDQVLDESPNRRKAAAHVAKSIPDEQFGTALRLIADSNSYVESPPWDLDPFAPDASTFTFMTWLKVNRDGGNMTLMEVGFGSAIRSFRVRFSRFHNLFGFIVEAPSANDKTKGSTWTLHGINHMPEDWAHVTFLWNPKGNGSCRILLNGKPFVGASSSVAPESLSTHTGPAQFHTYLGPSSFECNLAHFRIYTRELSIKEIHQDVDGDRVVSYRYKTAHTVDLSLVHQAFNLPKIYTDPGGGKMSLQIKSRGAEIATETPSPGLPDRQACNFEVAFRPGVLDPSRLQGVTLDRSSGGWELKSFPGTPMENYDSFCLLSKSPRPIPASGLNIIMDPLMTPPTPVKGPTMVNLRYRNAKTKEGEVVGSIQQRLEVGSRGKSSIAHPKTRLTGLAGWTIDSAAPPVWSMDNDGLISLTGHCFCVLPQGSAEKEQWLNTHHKVGTEPMNAITDHRFPGRVRCYSSGPPQPSTLWWNDLIVEKSGRVIIFVGLHRELNAAAARVDVFLDRITFLGASALAL